MLKTLFKYLCLFVISLPILIAVYAIDDTPLINNSSEFDDDQIAEIQQLLIDHDPRLLINTSNQVIKLSEVEANSIINYFKHSVADRLSRQGSHITLRDTALLAELSMNELTLKVSSPIVKTPFGQYLNYTIIAEEHANFIQIKKILINDLQIPALLYRPIIPWLEKSLAHESSYQLFNALLESVNQVSLQEKSLEVELNWQTNTITAIQEQARQAFISDEDSNKLMQYHLSLIEVIHQIAPPNNNIISINSLLRPMFRAAYINTIKGADPIAENRAVFIVLAAYLTDFDLTDLIDSSKTIPKAPHQFKVTLRSRTDLAQHMIGSAAIEASAGANVADILSIYKEVRDSRYSSGFSFSDLSANEVGTELGKISSQSSDLAEQLQTLLMSAEDENAYMPVVGPTDGLTEQEFIERYQDRNSPAYQQRLAALRYAISQRPLFQTMSNSTFNK